MAAIVGNLGKPNMRHMLSRAMANRLQQFMSNPLARITEPTSRQIRASVDSVISHIYKSLASTAGGNFEAFSAVARNPWLPMDLNGSGILLGKGQDSTKPISKTNPPDEETQAFMLEGGHFYTVNMYVPQKIKNEWEGRGKGDDAQGDYYIVVPPEVPSGEYEVYILEFKAGMTHLVMDKTEEEQMLKEKKVVETWYKALGKRVNVKLYYCPYLAGDAPPYRERHISGNVNYITLSGLSKILGIREDDMIHFAQVRSKFNEEFTKKAYAIRDLAIAKVESENPLSLNQLQALSSKSNFNVNFGPSIASSGNYQERRARIIQLLTRRKRVLSQLEQVNVKDGQSLKKELVNLTATILKLNRYPPGRPLPANKPPLVPVLANNSYTKMLNWLRNANRTNARILQEETAFRTILEERRMVLGRYTFPKLAAADILPPISASEATFLRLAGELNNKSLNASQLVRIRNNFKSVNRKNLKPKSQELYNTVKANLEARFKMRYKTAAPPVSASTKRKRNQNENLEKFNINEYFGFAPKKITPAFNKNAYIASIANRSNFPTAYAEFLTKNIPAGNLRQKLVELAASNTTGTYNAKRRYVNAQLARAIQ